MPNHNVLSAESTATNSEKVKRTKLAALELAASSAKLRGEGSLCYTLMVGGDTEVEWDGRVRLADGTKTNLLE